MLITDLLERVADCSRHLSGFLVTMDIQKAFDTLQHSFLILVFKKFDFGQKFINCIETL